MTDSPSPIQLRPATADDALCLGVLATQVFLDTYATGGIRPQIAEREHAGARAALGGAPHVDNDARVVAGLDAAVGGRPQHAPAVVAEHAVRALGDRLDHGAARGHESDAREVRWTDTKSNIGDGVVEAAVERAELVDRERLVALEGQIRDRLAQVALVGHDLLDGDDLQHSLSWHDAASTRACIEIPVVAV